MIGNKKRKRDSEMEEKYTRLGRNISILERVMKIYYNRGLEQYGIGWGQQFFLEYISDNPGSTPQEITEFFHVDKATITKLLKKLIEVDYINIVNNENDKRVRHIFIKESALPAVMRIKELHKEFYYDLTMGLNEEEINSTKDNMNTMILNLTQKVRYKMERQ